MDRESTMRQLISILQKLNGKTFTVLSVLACLLFAFYFFGCEATTSSLIDPNRAINRAELEAEIALLNSRINTRITGLDNQDKLKKALLDQASIVATGGQFNPIGAINSLISIFAVGYAVDSRRKLATANKKNTLTAPA